MNSGSKIYFIINPAAGGAKGFADSRINDYFKGSSHEIVVEYTKGKGDARLLAQKALQEGFPVVAAAGGDGTVNEVAGALLHSPAALGIIPLGSGNGLARHHKIPMDFMKSLEVIKRNNQTPHDAIKINEYISFNVSGIGFDAHVAHLFGKDGKRGFVGYAKLVMKEFKNYRDFHCNLNSGSTTTSFNAMLIAIANSSQFGNNAFIAPAALTNDGLVNISIVRKMPFTNLPSFALRVFNKTIASSPFASLQTGASFTIQCDEKMPLHIDGEPAGFNDIFAIQTIKSAIRLIIP